MVEISKIANIIYPMFCQTQYINAFYKLNDELKTMLEESGYRSDFAKKFGKSLKFLENLKENCTHQPRLFEKLTAYKGLYSIRFLGQMNIRVLFTFMEIKNRKKVILLYAFQEKDDKNDSNYGYEKAAQIAYSRIKEIIEWLNSK